MTSIPQKACSLCSEIFPETLEYFAQSKYGLRADCRECQRVRARKHYWSDPEKHKADAREYRQTSDGKLKGDEYSKKWRENNPDKVKESKKRDYEKHKDKRKVSMRKNYEKNKPAIIARAREWKKNNPDKVNIDTHKRLARIKGLPFNFNAADWDRCLEYWQYRCAICSREISETYLLAKDHWIPMFDPRPDNPGTVPTNIIPVCHGRKKAKCSGCNENKWRFDAEKWIRSQYPPDEADAIIKRIFDYFEWVKTRE